MMTKSVAFFCVLLIAELTFGQESCPNEKNIFSRRVGCNVLNNLLVHFNVKTITQPEQCSIQETVCVSAYEAKTVIQFKGKLTDKTVLKISGLRGSSVAQLPVLKSTYKQAVPPIVEWPLNPTYQTFELPVNGLDTADGCELKGHGECEGGGLCCEIRPSADKSPDTLTISGIKPPAFITLTKTSSPSDVVVIPVLVKGDTEEKPDPELLILPESGDPSTVDVHFPVETVKEGDAALNEIKVKETCPAGKTCYSIKKAFSTVKFEGKMPAEPVTRTISNGKNKKTFIFTSKGNTGTV